MNEIKVINKIEVNKRKLKDGIFLVFLLWFIMLLFMFYKNNSFLNYIFWFIFVANKILIVIMLYVFIITILKSIKIVKITKEINQLDKLFKY